MKVKNENVCFIYNVNCNAISVRKKNKRNSVDDANIYAPRVQLYVAK